MTRLCFSLAVVAMLSCADKSSAFHPRPGCYGGAYYSGPVYPVGFAPAVYGPVSYSSFGVGGHFSPVFTSGYYGYGPRYGYTRGYPYYRSRGITISVGTGYRSFGPYYGFSRYPYGW